MRVRRGRRDDRRGRLRGPRLRDQPGGDVDADGDGAGSHGARTWRPMLEGRAAREIGIALTPVRLKCAMLGLGVLKVALHKAQGHAAARRAGYGLRRGQPDLSRTSRSARSTSCRPARCEIVEHGHALGRRLQLRRRALRDRGPLLARRRPARPRATGTGRSASPSARATARPSTSAPADALTLPAFEPVETYPVHVVDGIVHVEARRVLDERVLAVLERLEHEEAEEREAGLPPFERSRQVAPHDRALPLRARRAPDRTARCSRSAARAATRRSGSPPARASSAAACSRSRTTRQVRGVAAQHRRGGPRRVGRARRGRRARDAARRSTTSSTSSSSTPRRTTTSSSSRSRAASSSRAPSSSRTTCSRTPRRSAPTRRPARPTRRSSSVTVPLDRGLELSVVLPDCASIVLQPRKGGGPVLSDSTGSGGTSG